MYIAKVIGKMVSVTKHKSYDSKTLLIVQRLDLNSHPVGSAIMAIDYIGAGEGDTVLVARTPGLAQEVFQIENAPICELIIAVIDSIDIDKTISEKNNELSK
jgi:ethanolamine utilization protein EutN